MVHVLMESLENRVLLNGAPQVSAILADNRGQARLTVTAALNRDTVNTNTCSILTAGADGVFKTADDVKQAATVKYRAAKNEILIRANLPADTPYRVLVKGNQVKSVDGVALDGEFNGQNVLSGNGKAGGRFQFRTANRAIKTAIFQFAQGDIRVNLFTAETPGTVSNFFNYANAGQWDGTVIHRSVNSPFPFVIQGGGFRVNAAGDSMVSAANFGEITNEPGISNIRGTIAMAKVAGNPDSATNQWFFNVGDNSSNLDNQNGGFTAFGRIINQAGLNLMDQINAADTVGTNLNPVTVPLDGQDELWADLPVKDLDAYQARGSVAPAQDLFRVQRVAIRMKALAI